MKLCFVTTFPDTAWELYAEEALRSLKAFLPPEVKRCVALDSDLLREKVSGILASSDDVSCVWTPEHREFVTRYRDRDHPTDYRKKATPFCHKIFALKYFFDRETASATPPDYLVWWDADAMLNRPVSVEELAKLMPGDDEAVSYLGRKDWDHSECGFMAFNVRHPGAKAILDLMHYYYVSGLLFSLSQWHDSFLFDQARAGQKCQNLSEGIPGNNIWAATALGTFSEHRKGVEAKARRKPLDDTEFYNQSGA
jgi:hypothetical protein